MVEYPFFHGATPDTFGNARTLRKKVTPAELELWKFLRRKQLGGLGLRKQHPAGVFILDFYSHDAKLAIELDGSHHANKEQRQYDEGRDFELGSMGIKVVRFKNEEVFIQLDAVLN